MICDYLESSFLKRFNTAGITTARITYYIAYMYPTSVMLKELVKNTLVHTWVVSPGFDGKFCV